MESKLRVLLIEDNPEDVYTIERMLTGLLNNQIVIEVAETLSEGLDRLLKGGIEIILLDLSLPDSHGLQTLKKFNAASINLPVIVLTGLNDEETAIRAISEGAQDYVCKNWMEPHSLWRSIRYAAERQKLMETLNEANQKILLQQKSVIEEERLKVLLQLSGATAHELNQPLMILLGNIDLMRLNKDTPVHFPRYIDKIETSGKRISEIVQKIQNIRYDETIPYAGKSLIININQKINLLSVEDSDDDFETLNAHLEANININLKRAKRIDESIKLLETEDFDLILSDFVLPDGNGFGMLSRMEKESIEVPLIIVTGQGDEIVASKIIEAGAYDYLPKDKINCKSLSRTIKNTLEKAHLKRQVKEAYKRIAKLSSPDAQFALHLQ
jgi:two-component system, cell cycle response regulator